VKILFVTTGYPTPSAPVAGIFVREHALAAARHADVAVLHLDRSRTYRGLPRVLRVEGEPLPTWRATYPWSPTALSVALHFAAAAQGWRAVRRAGFRADIVHANFFLAAVPVVPLSRAPLVVSEHWSIFLPDDPMPLTPPLRLGASFAYRNADVVMPVSEALRDAIRTRGLGGRRFAVVPNAVDTGVFLYGDGPRNGRLLAVGMLYEAKRYDNLLRAMADIDVGLDIVGDGEMRAELEELARSLGVADRVAFHGVLAKPEVARMMREAELLVLSSRYENNPTAVLEALVSGLPVVATAVGGVPELVTEGNGRLVRPLDVDDLVTQIEAARGATFDRATISANARRRFGSETVGDRFAEIYRSVVPT
jgi:glycosyltransferase involved in cell wall biosynthesis